MKKIYKNPQRKEVIPAMKKNSNGVRIGRPLQEDRDEIIMNNGFSVRQWRWLKKEAKAKGIATMAYIRQYPIQWWIDDVEASRNGSIATPEDDEEFNKLTNKSNYKNKE